MKNNVSVNNVAMPVTRAEFFQALETYTSLSKSSGKMMALVLIDIENLKHTNKNFGYQTGESFIYATFKKLEGLAKFSNCVYRINDSVVALILPVIQHRNMLALAANKILAELKMESRCNGTLLQAEPRLGMAASDDVDFTAEKLFRSAEVFLQSAVNQRRPYVLIMDEQEEEIENFAEKFTSALNNNEFELYYQPQSTLISGDVLHVEALLRWEIDENTFVPPEVIIAQAEKSIEQNFSLTKWVVNAALRQIKEWLDLGKDLSVSVNVSASLIHRSDLVTMIQDALTIWAVPAKRLTIEITETAIMTNKSLCHDNLNSIRDHGMNLSIDDFGTGYSSLSYFKQIPANELKIDKLFILNLMTSDEDKNLVCLMIQIAHSFNIKVVAEGIESKDCYEFLQEVGCDYGQGYFISKAQKPEVFLNWLNENQEDVEGKQSLVSESDLETVS